MLPSSPIMTCQSGLSDHVTGITRQNLGLTGAKWGAISDPHGATSRPVKRSKHKLELASSHYEPHRPTPKPSFASRGSASIKPASRPRPRPDSGLGVLLKMQRADPALTVSCPLCGGLGTTSRLTPATAASLESKASIMNSDETARYRHIDRVMLNDARN